MHLRSYLARGADLGQYTSLSVGELAAKASSAEASERAELVDLYPLLSIAFDYLPVDLRDIPHSGMLESFGTRNGTPLLHSFGAIECLERCLELLAPGGYILLNDYAAPAGASSLTHQRFGGSVAISLNLELLDHAFARRPGCCWAQPDGDYARLQSRLLGRGVPDEAVQQFREAFSANTLAWLAEPAERARTAARDGRREAALAAYREAVERQPHNWGVLAEVAGFLTFSLGDYAAGETVARSGLERHPLHSGLWETLGCCLLGLGRVEEADQALGRALELNPSQISAYFNRTFAQCQRKDYAGALAALARAFVEDRQEVHRGMLLARQAEVLDEIYGRHRQLLNFLADRFGGWEPARQDAGYNVSK
jgi:tetratricopeptide (TPR) repeat protein